MKNKAIALLLSLVMVVTFMPAMTFTAFAEDEVDGGVYSAELFINSEVNDIDLLPGDSAELEAKLFFRQDINGRLVTKEIKEGVTFSFDEEEENDAFVPDDYEGELPEIISIASSDAPNIFTCTANKVTLGEDDENLLEGHAGLKVVAHYDYDNDGNAEEIPCDWSMNVNVRCDLDYVNYEGQDIYSQEENKNLNVSLGDFPSDGIIIEPKYTNSDTQLNYNFFIFNEYWLNPAYEEEITGQNKVVLDKAKVEEIIDGRGTAFDVWVTAVDTEGKVYKNERICIMVDDGLEDIFGGYYIDHPYGIKYDSTKTDSLYDIMDQFVLREKGSQKQVTDETFFEWRIVSENPDTLLTKEESDAASVLTDLNNPRGSQLRLDGFGTYWVIAAGISEHGYKGFVIDSFELTDAENFYLKKPKAFEELEYTEAEIKLVSEGKANNGVVQYKMTASDDATYSSTIPTAIEPGDYNVSFRVVDNETDENVLIAAESVAVRINKQIIRIALNNNINKVYGEMDPNLNDSDNLSDIVLSADAIPTEVKESISFTRERGEDAGEYNIYARCESEHYDPVISNGKLVISKAEYHLSAADIISFNYNNGSCVIPYNTDAEKVRVIVSGDALRATARDGNLTLEASGPITATVKLIAEDENHNEAEKEIKVIATEAGLDASGDAAYVSSLGTNTIPDTASAFSSEASGDANNNAYAISFKDASDNAVPFNNTEKTIVVKIKLDGDMERLADGTAPEAKCIDAASSTDATKSAWFELIDGYYYICFETNHLSNWSFSSTAPIDFEDCSANALPNELQALVVGMDEETGEVFYNDINLGEELIKDASGNTVPRASYILKFSRAGEECDRINKPGEYSVSAEAIRGMGYIGEIGLGSIIVAEGCQHEFGEEWKSNKEFHWHECSACAEMADIGTHIYDRDCSDDAYLVSPATCTSPAKYYKSCECGEKGVETFYYGDALGHDLKMVPAVKATEESDGNIKYYRCSRCGNCYKNRLSKETLTIDEITTKYKEKEDPSNVISGAIVAGVAIVGATVATVAIVKTVDKLVEKAKQAEAEREAAEEAKKAEEAKTTAQQAINEALGDSTNPVVNELFNKGYAAITNATTADDIMAATVEYVNLIDEAKAIAATKISQNKLSAAKNGKIKVTFKNPGLDGTISYQVVRSTKKDFSKNKKVYSVKAKDQKTLTLTNAKNLKKGTKYYYRVRAKAQLEDGTVVWSDWSNTRYTTCKKSR